MEAVVVGKEATGETIDWERVAEAVLGGLLRFEKNLFWKKKIKFNKAFLCIYPAN